MLRLFFLGLTRKPFQGNPHKPDIKVVDKDFFVYINMYMHVELLCVTEPLL